jgi:hypothetical protein
MSMVDFQWWRCLDGYRLERTEPRLWTRSGRGSIVKQLPGRESFGLASASDRFEQYRPLEISGLFSIFADTPSSPGGMKSFCDRFGLLGGWMPHLAAPRERPSSESASVDVFLGNHRAMRRALGLFRKGAVSELATYWNSLDVVPVIRAELRASQERRPEMVFAPSGLLQAMWLQFGLFACSGAQLLRCERCNEPFVVGPRTGRRSTSKFCSNACKVAAFKERHASQ